MRLQQSADLFEQTLAAAVTGQIFFGSVVLGICSLFHVAVVAWTIGVLGRLREALASTGKAFQRIVVLGLAFAGVLASHTIQVWFWAFCFVYLGALPDIGEAIYFSLVTYTTVGYGDVTLTKDFHIFGAMAAVTGLFNFGLSTAFLVGAFGRLVPFDDA